jgi:hypothetical protein
MGIAMDPKIIAALYIIDALKRNAREEAQRLRRVLNSSALARENDPHLTYLRTMPEAVQQLLARYTPYFNGSYICPKCHIWQHKMERLNVNVTLSGDIHACTECSFMLVSEPAGGPLSVSSDP